MKTTTAKKEAATKKAVASRSKGTSKAKTPSKVVTSTAGATLRVTVANGRAKAPGAAVVVTNADHFKTELQFADKKGVCIFPNLLPGRYSVAAMDTRVADGVGVAIDYVLITSDKENYEVALKFGNTGGIGNINVTVLANGNPVQGALVNIKSMDPGVQYDETKLTQAPNGIASFSPPNGWHTITVTLPPYSDQASNFQVASGQNSTTFHF